MSVLRAEALTVTRGGRSVLRDISLTLAPGEMVALLGANGSGKTTLLRALLGLVRPESGVVSLDGRPLASLGRRAIARAIAYVPQHHRTVFPFSVCEMVAMGRAPVSGWAWHTRGDAPVSQALELAGIAHLAERPFTALSGGEQQSVLIARALAQGARMLLLDEPSAALDPGQKQRLLATLAGLAKSGMTVLASIHDPDAAIRNFDRAIMLHGGTISADGSPPDMLTGDFLARAYDL